MQLHDSLKTILTLSTKYKIVYKQFTYLKTHLFELDSINIAEHDVVLPLRKTLIATTCELMFLISESILEEFNEVLTPKVFPAYREQILLLKQEAKPATKRFNKWTQRRLYRNSLVAHNLRLKDNTSLFERNEKLKINAPHFDNDIAVIYYLHVFLCMCIGKHFPEQVNRLNPDTLLDKIEFNGEFTSLFTELPLIQEWFNSSGFYYHELSNHIESLNRNRREGTSQNNV